MVGLKHHKRASCGAGKQPFVKMAYVGKHGNALAARAQRKANRLGGIMRYWYAQHVKFPYKKVTATLKHAHKLAWQLANGGRHSPKRALVCIYRYMVLPAQHANALCMVAMVMRNEQRVNGA